MYKSFLKMSFRNKILTVFLLNTILLSGFSLIFVQSIEEINLLSQQVKDTNIPKVKLISSWEKELKIKQHIVESYISNNSNDSLIETYKAQKEKEQQISTPTSLEDFERKMKLLDFIIINNVQGLIIYGDEKAAKDYIIEHYLPEMENLQKELEELKENNTAALNVYTDEFSTIIKQSLLQLFFMTLGAVSLSIYVSYRISSSLTKPIDQMITSVDDIANGQYGLTINKTKQIELNHLTDSINKMSFRLKESFDTILADKIYLDQILNSLPVGIITSDDQTDLFSLNTAAQKLLDIDDKKLKILNEEEAAQNKSFWDILLSKRICENLTIPLNINSENYQLLVSQSELLNQDKEVVGRIFYFVDITKTNELQNRIYQSEKLALVGELAAGAAHEIRNPLAVIKGFLSLMNQSFSDSEKERFFLPLVMTEIDRINLILEEMLLLSKPEAPILKRTFIEDITNEILPLIAQSTSKQKQIQFMMDLVRVPVIVDANQIKQVLHNLIRNSMEAINGQGSIHLYSKIENDTYHIYIKDSGTGIPQEIQKSIYNPFLTSKGNGTGLGLTIVQRIIQIHGGSIELVSTSSEGTTFLISLPIHPN